MIDKTSQQILSMINKPYGEDLQGQNRKFICWKFCREIYSLLGLKLDTQSSLRQRLDIPVVPCIVMFRAGVHWHSGIVWPDGLHFIHACSSNIFELNPTEYIVRKDRLTIWPYNLIIEGYYAT